MRNQFEIGDESVMNQQQKQQQISDNVYGLLCIHVAAIFQIRCLYAYRHHNIPVYMVVTSMTIYIRAFPFHCVISWEIQNAAAATHNSLRNGHVPVSPFQWII